jgi:hypothetical protein
MKNTILYIIILLLLIGCNSKQSQNQKEFSTSLIDSKNTPIVKFKNNKSELKFIIDTGSEISIIDDDYYLNHLQYFNYVSNTECDINTLSGTVSSGVIIATTVLDDNLLSQFYITDIDNIKKEVFINTGKNIDGILGCDFLYRNKSIIDFKHKVLSNREYDATVQH